MVNNVTVVSSCPAKLVETSFSDNNKRDPGKVV